MEIAVAQAFEKNIYVLNNLAEQNCQEEVEALATLFLFGKIELLKSIK